MHHRHLRIIILLNHLIFFTFLIAILQTQQTLPQYMASLQCEILRDGSWELPISILRLLLYSSHTSVDITNLWNNFHRPLTKKSLIETTRWLPILPNEAKLLLKQHISDEPWMTQDLHVGKCWYWHQSHGSLVQEDIIMKVRFIRSRWYKQENSWKVHIRGHASKVW